MPLLHWISKKVRDTPLERLTRSLYIRIWPAKSIQNERDMLKIIRRTLRPNSNAIDIGAFRGGVLAEIVRRAPAGTHYAFEPLPEHFQYLVRSFPQVRVFPFALSDKAGEAPFHHVTSRPTFSGLKAIPIITAHEQTEMITVQTQTLDNLIPLELPIHFIKIDVEGAEYLVFSGGLQTIRRNQPTIVFEHGPASEWCYGRSSVEVFDLLTLQCYLQVSTLRRWLQGHPALTQQEFVYEITKREYNFIAYA